MQLGVQQMICTDQAPRFGTHVIHGLKKKSEVTDYDLPSESES